MIGSSFILKSKHNHGPDARVYVKDKFMNEIKTQARASTNKPRAILTSKAHLVDDATAGIVPSTSLIGKTINRARNGCGMTSYPKCLEDFKTDGEYGLTEKKKSFILNDNADNDNRIVIFSTEDNLRFLAKCPEMQMDGTFDIAPPLFKQLYTIFGRKDGWNIPIAYALCSNKTQITYEYILNVLIEKEPSLKPTIVMSDFEKAALNAIRSVFVSSQVAGCQFHYSGAVYKHVQSCGLQSKYATDPEFALNIRMFLALSYLPAADIEAGFEELLALPFCTYNEEDDLNEQKQQFFNYMEFTWIGNPNARTQRKRALFEPEIWSIYERTLQGILISLSFYSILGF